MGDDCSESDQQLVVRAKVVETKIRGLQKSIRKECAAIRMRKRDLFNYYSKSDRVVVLKSLGNKQLYNVVKSYIEQDSLTENQQLLARRYLMRTLLYTNTQ